MKDQLGSFGAFVSPIWIKATQPQTYVKDNSHTPHLAHIYLAIYFTAILSVSMSCQHALPYFKKYVGVIALPKSKAEFWVKIRLINKLEFIGLIVNFFHWVVGLHQFWQINTHLYQILYVICLLRKDIEWPVSIRQADRHKIDTDWQGRLVRIWFALKIDLFQIIC